MREAAIVAMLVLASVFLKAEATDLWVYDDDDYDKHKKFKKFNFGTSQRCYNMGDCFNNKASSADWINAPKHSWIVFYDQENCSGDQHVSTSTPSGELKFASVGLDNKASSFMIWEYGTFALKGFWDICNEAAILMPANTSSSSGVDEAGSNATAATVSFY
jgi:hypothetical protein